jgi:plastocyanin
VKTAKPTPKPTPRPTLRPTPAPVLLGIEARDFQFAPASLVAPAGVPLDISFINADVAIPHNVSITTSAGATQFAGKIITGVATVIYEVPALAVGIYRLGCIVHPTMTGSLTVD